MPSLEMLSLYDQAILVLASLVLFTCFALLGQSRMFGLIGVFAWQGALLSLTTALVAISTGHHHLYVSAALTLALKALFIPWMLRRLVTHLRVSHQVEVLGRQAVVMAAGVALVVFSYWVALPVVELSTLTARNTIGLSLAMVLLSMLLMITRRQAVSQVVGFMAIENGLFFAAVVSTYGMPMVVELGIAFDVLVAAVLFGVFFLHLHDTIDSLDVDRLSRLNEDVD